MFGRSAEFYDFLYEGIINRVYADDAVEIDALVQQHAPGASSLLDVACGTGGHLAALKGRYRAVGLDLAPEMVAIARARNPGVEIVEANMAGFDLGRTFDAVTCLFSSIAYMTTLGDLDGAIATMARHLAPGGVLLVEGFFEPPQWEAGRVAVARAERDGLTVVRVSHSGRTGRVAHLEFHYLVGTADGIEYIVEPHEMGLFTRDEYTDAFAKTGLSATRNGEALLGRGVYIGTRPA